MDLSQEKLESLAKKVQERERTIRRRSIIYALVPIILAGILIWFTRHQVIQARGQVAQEQKKLAEIRAEVQEKKEELKKVEEKLEYSTAAYSYALQKISPSDPDSTRKIDYEVTSSKPNIVGIIAPRIYIHIRHEAQREKAEQIAKKLQEQKYIVPGIQRVNVGPTKTQVRYFRIDDEDGASEIADRLKNLNVYDAVPVRIPGYEDSPKISTSPKYYEIWFSSNF